MRKLVVFDTDFIITNRNSFKSFLERFHDYDTYITQISLEELAKHDSFGKINDIKNFSDKILDKEELGIKFEKSCSEIMEIVETNTKQNMSEIFKDNIIKSNDRDFKFILDRAYNKQPPFGESDTGLKDTLIVLDIIDFIKENNRKNAFFVTNDADFIKHKVIIESEVKEKTGYDFEIVSGKNTETLLDYFKIGTKKSIEDLVKNIDNLDKKSVTKMREDLNDICFSLIHFVGYDPYDLGEYVGNNFCLKRVISKDEIFEFLFNLKKNINKYIFNSNVLLSNMFECNSVFYSENEIEIGVLERLNNIYDKVKENPALLDALASLLYSEINKGYISQE